MANFMYFTITINKNSIVLIIPLDKPITLPEARPVAKQTLSRNRVPRRHFPARIAGTVSPTAAASLPAWSQGQLPGQL